MKWGPVNISFRKILDAEIGNIEKHTYYRAFK